MAGTYEQPLIRNLLRWLCAVVIPFMFSIKPAKAQIPDDLRNYLERFLEQQGSGADFTEISDELSALYQQPININRAGIDELLACPLLDAQLVLGLIEHRRKFGALVHVHELQLIQGFSRELITALQPFIRLETMGERGWKNLKTYWNQGSVEALSYTWFQQGNLDPRFELKDTGVNRDRAFLGDPIRSSLRLRYYKTGVYSLALTAEKDPGEPWWQSNGPDFLSGHLAIEQIGPFNRVIIGDYHAAFGQGLLLGSGLAFSQSANVMSIKRTRTGIRPYRSVNEVRFFRGVAAQWVKNNWSLHLMYSNNKQDGLRINDSTQLEEGLIADFFNSGLHRNRKEIASRNQFSMPMFAMAMEKKFKAGTLGVSYKHDFNPGMNNSGNHLYHWFSRQNSPARLLSVYGDYTLRNIHLFFEQVRNPERANKSLGSVVGLLMSLAQNLDVSLLYRNYDQTFNNPMSIGFGNNQSNEQGCYLGAQWRIRKNIGFLCYKDIWKSNWLRYQVSSPSTGGSWLAELNYARGKQIFLYLRYRETTQARNISASLLPIDAPSVLSVKRLRFHADYPAGKNLSFSTRFECATPVVEGRARQWGSLLFHEVQMNKPVRGYRISARLSFYDVGDYLGRIYAFEGDLPYVFNVQGFYGNGSSLYVMLRKKISRSCDLYMRFSSDLNEGRGQESKTLSGMIKWSF
ncbi:MAG: hypothetical protein RLZZ370_1107 [Bacteroidota bacterium]|jgi:hypothetical protein